MLESVHNSDKIMVMATTVDPRVIGSFENIEESIDLSKHERQIRIARLAMLIECEGHITIGMTPPTKTRNRPALYATAGVANTSSEIIDEAKATLIDEGIGFSTHSLRPNSGGLGKKWRYDISTHGFDRAGLLLTTILPFLRAKKRQAEIVLAYIESRRKAEPKSAYSDQEWRWATEVRKLNGRQPERKALTKARAYLESSGDKNPRTVEYFTRYVAMCEELQRCLERTV